jgi:hypothetical protein
MSQAPPTHRSSDITQTRQLQTSSDSLLLKLPGELRNRICQYALTSPHELYMILDHDDKIFGIFENPDGKIHPEEFLSSKVFNQLKYTCHQLDKETAGTEVKCNDVRIVSNRKGVQSVDAALTESEMFWAASDSARSAEGFVEFFKKCKPHKAAWFENVFIGHVLPTFPFFDCTWINDHPEDRPLERAVRLPDYFIDVAKYCRDHPHTTVNITISEWGRWEGTLAWHIPHGLWLAQLYGGKGKELRDRIITDVEEMRDPWHFLTRIEEWHLDSDCAFISGLSNLRFWPYDRTLDETDLRERLEEYPWLKPDECVELVKQWIEHGLL